MERELIAPGTEAPHVVAGQHQGTQARSQNNVGEAERWLSAIGGGALTTLGFRRGSWPGALLAALGGALVWRGVSGHCSVYNALGVSTAQPGAGNISVQQSITINAPAEELYRFWRNFENLPRFMNHLKSVSTLDQGRSRWVAKAPADTSVAWDAEIIAERENESIEWRSLPGATVDNAGSVRFVPAPGGRGTEVHITIGYNPPAGKLGAAVAKLFGEEPNQQVNEDLRRFKRLMETGEVATTEGQPHGTRSPLGKLLSPNN